MCMPTHACVHTHLHHFHRKPTQTFFYPGTKTARHVSESTHVFGTHLVGQHIGETGEVGEDLHTLCPQVAHDDGQMLETRGKLDLHAQ